MKTPIFPPTVPTQTQIQLLKNKLHPVFIHEMKRSSFLGELPPVKSHEFYLSEFSVHVAMDYSFKMEAVCNTHFASYLTICNECVMLDKEIEKLKQSQSIDTSHLSDDDTEYNTYLHYRKLSGIHAHDSHLQEIKNITDQGFIVHLWSFNERSLSRMLKIFSIISGIKFTIPDTWNGVLKIFEYLEIDLSKIKNISATFDELRVLNNKIKHLGEVDKRLAEFPRFSNSIGLQLDNIELDLQEYLNSSYAFFNFFAQELWDISNDNDFKIKLLKENKNFSIT